MGSLNINSLPNNIDDQCKLVSNNLDIILVVLYHCQQLPVRDHSPQGDPSPIPLASTLPTYPGQCC